MNKYQGLTNEEAKGKLLKNGKNILVEEKERTLFQIFLSQIFNFTNLILTVAIIISFILKDYSEAGIVAGIIIINAIIGVVQEGKAQRALSSLKKMSALKANVIRNGEIIEIPSEEIVVDDIVSIDAGQQIPADIKLLETHDFSVDEKILTGESVPVEKDANTITDDNTPIGDKLNYAFMSTVATYGRAIGVVEKTGMNTEIGKIADMVNSEKKNLSPLQKAMDKLSKMLGIACVFICVIVCLVGILQGKDIYEMLMTSVSLAVAAIPEGIPTIITIVMALGMIRMAKLNAIVKKLSSVETLGSVSYVCSDKTGTLTMNKMTVVKAFVDGKFTELDDIPERDKIRFLKGLVLCNDAYISDDAKVWATRGPGKQYKLSGQIRIGERVEFLSERNDYAEIRTPTGSVVWVPKREIQFEESNLYKVTRLSQENTELKFKLDNIDSETIRDLKKATTELEALRKEHDALKKAHEEMEEQMKETTELNEELKGRLETKDLDKQLKWWTRGGIIALSGALVGVILVYLPRPRRRNRRYY